MPKGFTYDEATRTITLSPYPGTNNVANGAQDYLGSGLAPGASRSVTLQFKIDDNIEEDGVNFKSYTRYKNSDYIWQNQITAKGSVKTLETVDIGEDQKIYIDTKSPAAPKVDEINTSAKVIKVTPPTDPDVKTIDVTITGKDGTTTTVTVTKDENNVWKTPEGTNVTVTDGKLQISIPSTVNLVAGENKISAIAKDHVNNASVPGTANVTNSAPTVEVPKTLETYTRGTKVNVTKGVTVKDTEDDTDKNDAKKTSVKYVITAPDNTTVTYIKKGDGSVVKVENGVETAVAETELTQFSPTTLGEYTVTVTPTDSDGLEGKAASYKFNVTNPAVVANDKILVANKDALTSAEKDILKAAIKDKNVYVRDNEIVVANNGDTTVTQNGKTTKFTQDQTVEQLADPVKTTVKAPSSLTVDEKAAVKAQVRAIANLPTTVTDNNIVVNADGSAVITIPAKGNVPSYTIEVPATKTVQQLGDPIKTVVKDASALTEGEKAAVKAQVEKSENFPAGATVVVDKTGKATITVPAKGNVPSYTIEIPATKTVQQLGDPIKTVVKDASALTEGEKAAVKAQVEKSENFPAGATVVVDKTGKATITVPAKGNIPSYTIEVPATKTVQQLGDPIKTVVKDVSALTEGEKAAVKAQVEKSENFPAGATVVVDKTGKATITVPAKGNIPSYTIEVPATKTVQQLGDPIKTVVKDASALTEGEKAAVKAQVEKSENFPAGATVVVDKTGKATITVPDKEGVPGYTIEVPATKTVQQLGDPIKTVVKDASALTEGEKAAVKAQVEKSENFPAGATVVVDKT
ncbi:hypothetical protein, partial [Staphylococcus americanisciuri]